MHHGFRSATRAKLSAFLAAHVGTAQCEDIGALLGQAALYYDTPTAGEAVPADWTSALSAALAGEPARSSAPKVAKHGRGVRRH